MPLSWIDWGQRHSLITKCIIAVIVLIIVVLSFVFDSFGDVMSVLVSLGLCGLGLWAISSLVYAVFFE